MVFYLMRQFLGSETEAKEDLKLRRKTVMYQELICEQRWLAIVSLISGLIAHSRIDSIIYLFTPSGSLVGSMQSIE